MAAQDGAPGGVRVVGGAPKEVAAVLGVFAKIRTVGAQRKESASHSALDFHTAISAHFRKASATAPNHGGRRLDAA